MKLLSIYFVCLFSTAVFAEPNPLVAICLELKKSCDADVLAQQISKVQGIDEKSVLQKIDDKFMITSSVSKNGITTWKKIVGPDRLKLTDQLIQGSATVEEAIYFSTFLNGDDEKEMVKNFPVIEDRVRLYRFQFKTKRNKTECMKAKLSEVSDNVCRATEKCSIPCQDLDKPVLDRSTAANANKNAPPRSNQ